MTVRGPEHAQRAGVKRRIRQNEPLLGMIRRAYARTGLQDGAYYSV